MSEIRRTVSLQTAERLVDDGALPGSMRKALADLQTMNYSEIDVVIEYGDAKDPLSVGLQGGNGIMVGFFLPEWVGERIALPGGEDVCTLHVTLAYIGSLDEIDVNQQRTLIGVVAELARDSHVLSGVIAGLNTFPDVASLVDSDEDGDADKDDTGPATVPLYAAVTVPGLYELRAALLAALDDAGVPYDTTHTNFVPHVTLAYVDPATVTPDLLNTVGLAPVPVTLRDLTVAIGGAHFTSSLFGDQWGEEELSLPSPAAPSAYRPTFAKAAALAPEEQFTLAPWYVPDFLDAHGEWMANEDVEPAFHAWMADAAHEGIRFMHEPTIVAGKVVEGYVLRQDTTFQVPNPDTGVEEPMLLKAGTPLVGTKWADWAWPLVKEGKIRGLSVGGSATPVEQPLA